MKIQAVAIAIISIFLLIVLGRLFSWLNEIYGVEVFRCASTATCMMIANIIMFLIIFLVIPESFYESLALLSSPSKILQK